MNVPLYGRYSEEHLDIVAEESVPVLVAAQGGASRYADRFRGTSTTLLHVVSGIEHARKAVRAGVNGLIVVGAEAGGHPPGHGVPVAILVREVLRDRLDVPVATSGGVADGYGVAAMLALGADAVQLGTRFAASVEANLHEDYKTLLTAGHAEDPVVLGGSGQAIRVLPNAFTTAYESAMASGKVSSAQEVFAEATLRQAAILGDVGNGKVEAGQTVGLVDAVLPAGVIVERLVAEYEDAVWRLGLAPRSLESKPPEALLP